MYKQKNKQIMIIIVSLILLIVFSMFSYRVVKEHQRLETVEGKCDELGTEEFRFLIYDPMSAKTGEQDVCIEWWKNEQDNTYYLFLPSAVENKLIYLFNCYSSVLIDDIEIKPGDEFQLSEGIHQMNLEDGKSFSFRVMRSKNIASMFIETESGNMDALIEDRDNIEKGSYVLFDETGKMDCSGKLDEIHSRGNASFLECDKKSFTLRMSDKTSVLDMGISRKWLLLANATDETLIRNQVVMEMGNRINMAYVPDMVHVDLYVNGEYQGNYQLAEKVEIADGRVAICDLKEEMEDVNPNVVFSELRTAEEETEVFPSLRWVNIQNLPLDSKSGYLLELDIWERYEEEACGFISSRNQAVAAKDPQYVNYEQIWYLANKYQDMEDALYNPDGYNEKTGLYYYDYLDIESFAQKYLIEEVGKNMDASLTSFFIYIPEENGKFYAGPIWDYDRTFGVDFDRNGIDLKDPNSLFASENVPTGQAECNILYLLCQQDEFQTAYKEIYFEKMRAVLVDMTENSFEEYGSHVEESAMMNAIRWNTFECGTDIEENRKAFWESNEKIKAFLEQRIQFLDEEWK